MPKVAKSQSELEADFGEAVELLEIACLNYDTVTFAAAKTISNLLHQLVDDRGSNRSHLTKLGIRDDLTVWRSPDQPSPETGFSNPLIGVMFGIATDAGGKPIPKAFNLPAHMHEGQEKIAAQASSVDEWLASPIIRLSSGETMSRRKLIQLVRDQDAGAHSDPALDQLYVDFKQSIAINPKSTVDILGHSTTVDKLLQNPALATLRQVAHEFLSSLYSDPKFHPNRNPRSMIYEYDNEGRPICVRRPKGYPKLPILPPHDLLVEH